MTGSEAGQHVPDRPITDGPTPAARHRRYGSQDEDDPLRYKSLPYSVRSATPAPTPRSTGRGNHPARQPRRMRDLLAMIPIVLLLPALVLPFVVARASTGGALIASPAELSVLPTSGTAWTSLKAVADGSLGSADLTDQDNQHAIKTLGVALVANRLNSDAYRAKARAAVMSAIGTERVGADNSILALGRQLGSYVLAADVIGLSGTDDATFRTWLSSIRTRDLGGHGRYYTLKGTCEDSPHNWGTFACASKVAADLYLRDTVAIERSWAVFRGLTGERSIYAGFQDMSSDIWACPGKPFTPFNSGCPGDLARYGAFVKDVTRGDDPPTPAGAGLSYTNEIMQGVAFQAELLARAGHGDAWIRLRPAFDWARRNGALDLSASVGKHVTWWANERLGWSHPTAPAGIGRLFGYTDWLYGSPLSGTVAVPTTSPTPTPKPTTTPTPASNATPVPTATPAATATPGSTATPTATPASTATPTAAPTATPTAAPTATPAPTRTTSPTPVPAGTIAVRSTSTGANATSTNLVIDRPSGVQAGDLLIAAVDVRAAPSIQPPSGWDLIRVDANGTIMRLATYFRVAGSSEPGSYTWRFSKAEAAAGAIVALRGSNGSLSDAAGRINARATAILGPATSADENGSLVLAFFAAARSTSISPPDSMVELGEASSARGRYKTTLEVAATTMDRGVIGVLSAAASGTSESVAQVIVIRP